MYFKVETTTIDPGADILHPDDAQYIWLPISVLVGIFILAALVRYFSYLNRRCLFIQVHLHLFSLIYVFGTFSRSMPCHVVAVGAPGHV